MRGRVYRPSKLAILTAILVALLVTMLPVSSNSPSSAAAAIVPTESASQPWCADVLIVGVSGSGQQGYGREVGAAVEHLDGQISSKYTVRKMPLAYPAAGIDALIYDMTAGIASGEWTYFESVGAGQIELMRQLGRVATECPDEKWILAGYSQGALVINQAAGSLSWYADRILGVLMIADPSRSYFNYDRQNFGNASGGFGVNIAFPGYSSNYYPYEIGWVTVEVCMEADLVCDYSNWSTSLIGIPFGVEVHKTYPEILITTAADTFLPRALAPKPPKAPVPSSAPYVEAVGPGSIKVSWSPFSAAATSPITRYRILVGGPGTAQSVAAEVGAEIDTVTLSGLTGGSTITATVEGVVEGASAMSEPSVPILVPPTVPQTQHNHLSYRGSTPDSISFSISPPQIDGGSPISRYRVTTSDLSAPYPYPEVQTYVTGTLDATISGLKSGTGYRFVVDACNMVGCAKDAEHRIWYTQAVAPGPPTNLQASIVSLNSVDLSWTPPAPINPPLTSYLITLTSELGNRSLTVDGSRTGVTVGELAPSTAYEITVSSVNFVGPGKGSEPAKFVTLAAIPLTPAAPVVTLASPNSLSVSWSAPPSNGAEVTGYEVSWHDGSAVESRRVTADSMSTTLEELTADRSYTVTVAAIGTSGVSAHSAPSKAVYVPGSMPAATPIAFPERSLGGPNDPGLTLSANVQEPTTLRVSGLQPSRWYYASRFSSPLGSGWYLADNAGVIAIDTSGAKAGNHRVVVQGRDGAFVGSELYLRTPNQIKSQSSS